MLVSYYLDQQLSLAEIDRRTGLPAGSAARLARQYGIPVRGGIDRTKHDHPRLPRSWLFEQHVTHQRTLADLAREKHLSKATVTRWAHLYGIPVRRPRVIPMNIPAAAAAAPPLLRPAITGPNAWRRLHRFANATAHPTFTQAAAALGLQQTVLIHHLDRLEQEFGQHLVERNPKSGRRTTRPTTFGRRIIAAVRRAPPRRRLKTPET